MDAPRPRLDLAELAFRHRAALLAPPAAAVVAWALAGVPGTAAPGADLLALTLAFGAAALRLGAVRAIGKRARVHRAGARELLVVGPFRWVRNPLYLANAGVALGLAALAAQDARAFVVPAWILAVYALVVRHEERALAATFGPVYDAFCAEVPRWVPRPPRSPVRAASEPWPWPQVLRRELGLVAGVPLAVAAILGARTGRLPLVPAVAWLEDGLGLGRVSLVCSAAVIAALGTILRTELHLRRHARLRAALGAEASPVTAADASHEQPSDLQSSRVA